MAALGEEKRVIRSTTNFDTNKCPINSMHLLPLSNHQVSDTVDIIFKVRVSAVADLYNYRDEHSPKGRFVTLIFCILRHE